MPSWSRKLPALHTGPSTHAPPSHDAPPSYSQRDNRRPSLPQIDPAGFQQAFPTLHPTTAHPSPPRSGSQKGRTHARSISNQLPAFLGGTKKKGHNVDTDLGFDSTDDDRSPIVNRAASQKRSTPNLRAEDGGTATGKCMACDAKVKWPKGLKVFRCGGCLTVNDLEPRRRDDALRHGEPPRPRTREGAGTYPGPAPTARVLPLTIERTRAIIDKCLVTYLRARLLSEHDSPNNLKPFPHAPESHRNFSRHRANDSQSSAAPTPDPGVAEGTLSASPPTYHAPDLPNFTASPARKPIPTQHLHGLGIQGEDGQNGSSSAVPARPSRKPPPPPVRPVSRGEFDKLRPEGAGSPRENHFPRHSPSPRLTQEEVEDRMKYESVKAIFRPLEDYLAASYGDFECLNRAFTSFRPRMGGRTRSESSVNTAATEPKSANAESPDFSELDAKMLLLGDFAENGSWWTGRVERNRSERAPLKREVSTNSVDNLVTSKSPQIDWVGLNSWYHTVTQAGAHWKERLRDVHSSKEGRDSPIISGEDAEAVEEDLYNARIHVQRTLLKVTENLLKRPGRPLRAPDDTRFLLLILSNPLLYPSSGPTSAAQTHLQTSRAQEDRTQSTRQTLDVPSAGRLPHPTKSPSTSKREASAGHHSGIIKRVIGLIANLPGDTHRYFVSWFARFEEHQFRRTVDLISRFITYRLTRSQQGKQRPDKHDPTAGLIPEFSGAGPSSSAQLHAALGLTPSNSTKEKDGKPQPAAYSEDWQLQVASKVMSLLFAANNVYYARRPVEPINIAPSVAGMPSAGLAARERARSHGQLLPTSDFYNTLLDYNNLIADYEAWESRKGRFSFCQYPFLLSIGTKIRILEHDAQRQMENKAREAFFNSLLSHGRQEEQHFHLRVRRDCLVDDSLQRISEVVGAGSEDIKKGLRVHFVGEEGVDAGGPRKEWFLLLVRDIFDPDHGMFVYDDDSHFCYFNPYTFEASDQYFLVGALLGLAIYNSTILDIALPPFAFRKLLAAAPAHSGAVSAANKASINYTLDDLAELKPPLAHGLRQLLEYDGNVEETFCRDFVADIERYGTVTQVPLCPGGEHKPVTNDNRQEFVDLYVRFLLDTSVSRQFEPFRRGFFTVCGGNALSLFRPEEIELLVRGSDEPLDVASIRAVAIYEGWKSETRKIERPGETVLVLRWFWDFFDTCNPQDQRKILSFVTGSDRIPAVGATSLVIKVACLGEDCERFPIARTCFNQLGLYKYSSRQKLEDKLWRAVVESEGFGLK